MGDCSRIKIKAAGEGIPSRFWADFKIGKAKTRQKPEKLERFGSSLMWPFVWFCALVSPSVCLCSV